MGTLLKIDAELKAAITELKLLPDKAILLSVGESYKFVYELIKIEIPVQVCAINKLMSKRTSSYVIELREELAVRDFWFANRKDFSWIADKVRRILQLMDELTNATEKFNSNLADACSIIQDSPTPGTVGYKIMHLFDNKKGFDEFKDNITYMISTLDKRNDVKRYVEVRDILCYRHNVNSEKIIRTKTKQELVDAIARENVEVIRIGMYEVVIGVYELWHFAWVRARVENENKLNCY